MFLDDIGRDEENQRKKPRYWDAMQYQDVTDSEVVVALIDQIQLLYLKNLGEEPVFVDIHKLKLKLFPGEEKYFPGIKGVQVVLFSKNAGTRVFVGQSRRLTTNRPKNLLFGVICLFCICLMGCSRFEKNKEILPIYPQVAKPSNHGKLQLPRTPKVP